jgi:hypothetical protein
MPAFKQRIAVEMEDGSTWEAVADQRDLARYEVQPFYDPDRIHTMLRFLAWSASYRAKQTPLSWDLFNASCVEAGDPVEVSVDPTQPGQLAGR